LHNNSGGLIEAFHGHPRRRVNKERPVSKDKDVQSARSGKDTQKAAVSRRALLKKAGWAAPVVVAISIPMNAYACVSHTGKCPRSQGYYKNHDDWPVSSLSIGGNTYTRQDLMAILAIAPKKGNATVQLLHQLIAAKLNIAAGVDDSPVRDIIAAADDRLSNYGPLSPNNIPRPKNEDKQRFRDWAKALDEYNNGKPFPYCPISG